MAKRARVKQYIGGGNGNVQAVDSIVIVQSPAHTSPALYQLRAPTPDFSGRDAEIDQLVQALSVAAEGHVTAISGVCGMGGIGKTELAYVVAQQLTTTFSHAQIVLHLRGTDPAPLPVTDALRQVIRAFTPDEQPPDDLGELQARYRSVLSGRQVLILADNAKDAAQVELLRPPVGCALLITSRQRFLLDGMTAVDLSPLLPVEAERLLIKICPRIDSRAAELARLCGHLPLALRVSATLLVNDDTQPVGDYLRLLADERERLTHIYDPNYPSRAIEASLNLSYAALAPPAQQVLCQASVFPASFALNAAESVIQAPSDSVRPVLGLLRQRNLVLWNAGVERYTLHDLVRSFALKRLDDPDAVRLRHARHYADVAAQAQRCADLDLLDTEWAHIDAGWTWAYEQNTLGDADTVLLIYTEATIHIIDRHYRFEKRLRLLDKALALTRQRGSLRLQLSLLLQLGDAAVQLGDGDAQSSYVDCAFRWYQEAASIARDHVQPRDWQSESRARVGIGMVEARLGKIEQAMQSYMWGLALARISDSRHSICVALSNLGNAFVAQGRAQEAITCYLDGLALARQIDDHRVGVKLLRDLGDAYLLLAQTATETDSGDISHAHLQQADKYYRYSIALAKQIGDVWGMRYTRWHRGWRCRCAGQFRRAALLMEPLVALECQTNHPHWMRDAAILEETRHLVVGHPAATRDSTSKPF